MFLFDILHQFAKHCRLSDSSHIFQTNFRSACFYKLVCNMRVILYGMYRRGSDTQGSLRNHPCVQCIFNRRDYIANLVQSTENTSDIHSLRFLYFIHQPTYISRHRIHTQRIQASIEHMRLNPSFIERFRKSTHGFIRIFSI